ncbi:hypothetical protein CYY_000891 [Polysphondylium violaceum]|uniref:MRH domain-containing protein n=1 Tax=Polysphondylium violaceum TaxID=133409 RepID=A0A8J4Q2Z2_9MYCE|nr:hypothetical protein CYY_000891 [Polysphondylium violaceum]
MKIVIILSVFVFLSCVYAQQPLVPNQCRYQLGDDLYDFSDFAKQDWVYNSTDWSIDPNRYHVGVCTQSTFCASKFNGSVAVAACQENIKVPYILIATLTSPQFKPLANTTQKGATLVYTDATNQICSNGNTRVTNVQLICAPGQANRIVNVIEKPVCVYNVVLSGDSACPRNNSSSESSSDASSYSSSSTNSSSSDASSYASSSSYSSSDSSTNSSSSYSDSSSSSNSTSSESYQSSESSSSSSNSTSSDSSSSSSDSSSSSSDSSSSGETPSFPIDKVCFTYTNKSITSCTSYLDGNVVCTTSTGNLTDTCVEYGHVNVCFTPISRVCVTVGSNIPTCTTSRGTSTSTCVAFNNNQNKSIFNSQTQSFNLVGNYS